VVFLDASAIIYLIEGDRAVRQATQEVIKRLNADQSEPAFAVSALSLLECRVHPIREGDDRRLDRFDSFFNDPGLTIIELDRQVIDKATILRAQQGLRTPDALQAASCLIIDPKTPFITGDRDFKNLKPLKTHLIE